MADTDRFAEGNVVGYDGMIGIIKKNDRDPCYWEVEFKGCTRILHYQDMVFICVSQAIYEEGLRY
jgi:hypothetical protein